MNHSAASAPATVVLSFLVLILTLQPVCSQQHNTRPLPHLKDIRLEYGKSVDINPGSDVSLGVIALMDNGTEEKTKGWLGGNMKWNHFEVEVEGGTFNSHMGKISLSQDHQAFKSFCATVTVTPAGYPALKKSLQIPVSFTGTYLADYNGSTKGRIHHHSKGLNGYDLEVKVKAVENGEQKSAYLIVSIQCKDAPEKNKVFYLNSDGGLLKIDAGGSAGGKGVPGAWGGSGSGNGGPGGNGFDGGDGGDVRVFVDPSAEGLYKKCITVINTGGQGGAPGNGGNPGAKGGEKGKDGKPGNAGKDGTAEWLIKPADAGAGTK